MRTSVLLRALLPPLLHVLFAHAACECGYTATNTLYTDLQEADFLHLYSLPGSIDAPYKLHVGWQPQVYNVTRDASQGPYGKSATLDNIVLNPLATREDWGGSGILGGDPGLQLWVRSRTNLTTLASGDQAVQIAELDTERRDVLYGTFRVGMKTTNVTGTCAAFYWYYNNTQEIDLEHLSQQASPFNDTAPINLVVQSPQSEANGFDAANTDDFKLYRLPFMPSDGYHEYRFDWLPTRVSFYADGKYLQSFTDNVPTSPGHLVLSHWSNGNSGWSAGPPEVDALMTVSYVKAYFNSTNTTRIAQWHEACSNGTQGRTCQIPDQLTSIDPTGPQGHFNGHTFFFSEQEDQSVNQTLYPAATAVPNLARRSKDSIADKLLTGLVIVFFIWAALIVVSLIAVLTMHRVVRLIPRANPPVVNRATLERPVVIELGALARNEPDNETLPVVGRDETT